MFIMTSYMSKYIHMQDFHEDEWWLDNDDNFYLPEETTVRGVVFDGRHARVSEMETNL